MSGITADRGRDSAEGGVVMTSNQSFIASAREAFIADGIETPGVRPETLAAWRRSHAAGVSATGRFELTAHDEFDEDSSLLRAVRPVSEALMEQFGIADIGMMVTDRDARIVGRWTAGPLMRRQMDRMGAAPGVVFDESYVGSTGLGTALESRVPVVVDGAEHYNDSFDAVVAVGAPIVHPGTGVVEGVIDVVCSTGAPVNLLLPLVTTAAREAGDRLVSGYAREDRELLDAFIQSERRGARRPMVALNGRMMFTNNPAGLLLAGHSHPMLWEDVQRALADGDDSLILGEGNGAGALLARIRPVRNSAGRLGAVLQLSGVERPENVSRSTSSPARDLAGTIESALPGRSLRWTAVVRAVSESILSDRPVVLMGPPGSGKSVLAGIAAMSWAACREDVVVVEGESDLGSALASVALTTKVVVVEDMGSVEELDVALDWLATRQGVRLLVTMAHRVTSDDRDQICSRVTNVIEIPSLAHRSTDIGDLARTWSGRREEGGCAVEVDALRELTRRAWPGNVRQLFQTLDLAAANRSGPAIRRNDLPNDGRSGPRRQLTYLENVEREAIARLLEAAGGRKTQVARELGLSRSTLYRKLAALGLDD